MPELDLGNVKGPQGKSAYQGALDAGYSGSEEAFNTAMAKVPDAVLYTAQSLTDAQKAQARGNINAAPGGFGLGGAAKVLTPADDLNDVWEAGWYAWDAAPKNAPTVGGSLIPYCSMNVLNKGGNYNMHQIARTFEGYEIRRYYDGAKKTWSEWAWANPPMMAGVEYRTTEFYLGKPVAKKISEGFEMWTAEGVPVWVSAGKPICYNIEAGGTRSIALPRQATFLFSCSDNVRVGVAIVQSAGGAITSITPIVPLNSWGIEAGSGLTVNVTEKDTRFGMTVKIMML
nr:MAG TPA: hypothetical protein [Caudoviricetes sp.]